LSKDRAEYHLKDETKKFVKELFQGGYNASAIGMALALAIFIGFFLGYFLDRYFGTDYIFKIIGLIMGIIAGFRNVYLMGKKLGK
jgi:ATP synthase protein I